MAVQRRRLVICCDGTWNDADSGPRATNVLRMVRIIRPQAGDGTPQVVYYHTGVGTGNLSDTLTGGVSGIGLSRNIRDAYAFIVNNYSPIPGDELFLFGFSRGAYTARCLAGLIGAIGLLSPRDMGSFAEAWNWYRLPHDARDPALLDVRFPNRLPDVPIRCVGVWDTVGALGVPSNRIIPGWQPCARTYQFHDARLGGHVQHAFHALAIDERRLPFRPVLWQLPEGEGPRPVLRQVWFPGVHSDVGGGYEQHGAADLAFLWMAAQVAPLIELDSDWIAGELDLSEAYGCGTLHDSYSIGWRLAGEHHRANEPGDEQYIHPAARDRPAARDTFRNPDFPYDTMRPWPLTDFERRFILSSIRQPSRRPALPGAPLGFCDGVVKLLGGG